MKKTVIFWLLIVFSSIFTGNYFISVLNYFLESKSPSLYLIGTAISLSIQLLTPTIVMSGFMFLFMLGGILRALIVSQAYLDIMPAAIVLFSYGIICMLLGSIFAFKLLSILYKNNTSHYFVWDMRRLRGVIILLFVLATLGTVGAIVRIGYIPMLVEGGIGLERSVAATRMGWANKLWSINVIVPILSVIYLCISMRKNYAIITIFLLSVLQLTILGARIYFILALTVSLFIYNQYRKKLNIAKVSLLLISFLMLSAVYVEIREGLYGFTSRPIYERILYNSFTEFREFARVVDYTSTTGNYLHGYTFVNTITTIIPRQFYTIVGKDKSAIISRFSSARYLAKLYNARGGLRAGLLGELYINFGLYGLLIGMIILGMLVGFLDYKVASRERFDARISFYFLFLSCLLYAIIGQIEWVIWYTYQFGAFLLLTYFICRKRHSV